MPDPTPVLLHEVRVRGRMPTTEVMPLIASLREYAAPVAGHVDSAERALAEAQSILRRVMASRGAPARDSFLVLVVGMEPAPRERAHGSR
jgi:hypothetical protein